jgi:molecular chaperone GrpE (heat shock protein)
VGFVLDMPAIHPDLHNPVNDFTMENDDYTELRARVEEIGKRLLRVEAAQQNFEKRLRGMLQRQ